MVLPLFDELRTCTMNRVLHPLWLAPVCAPLMSSFCPLLSSCIFVLFVIQFEPRAPLVPFALCRLVSPRASVQFAHRRLPNFSGLSWLSSSSRLPLDTLLVALCPRIPYATKTMPLIHSGVCKTTAAQLHTHHLLYHHPAQVAKTPQYLFLSLDNRCFEVQLDSPVLRNYGKNTISLFFGGMSYTWFTGIGQQ